MSIANFKSDSLFMIKTGREREREREPHLFTVRLFRALVRNTVREQDEGMSFEFRRFEA
jgi:hypothetical protein